MQAHCGTSTCSAVYPRLFTQHKRKEVLSFTLGKTEFVDRPGREIQAFVTTPHFWMGLLFRQMTGIYLLSWIMFLCHRPPTLHPNPLQQARAGWSQSEMRCVLLQNRTKEDAIFWHRSLNIRVCTVEAMWKAYFTCPDHYQWIQT